MASGRSSIMEEAFFSREPLHCQVGPNEDAAPFIIYQQLALLCCHIWTRRLSVAGPCCEQLLVAI